MCGQNDLTRMSPGGLAVARKRLPGSRARWVFLAFHLFTAQQAVFAQGPQRRVQLGVDLTGVHLHKLQESPSGVGLRMGLRLNRSTWLEATITRYPENPSGNFGETGGLFGFRTGRVWGKYGIFPKARAGVMHFGGAYFDLRLPDRTVFALDLGVVLEYLPSDRTAVRIDLGDTVLFYGSQRLFPSTIPLGTVHNFQPGLGFSYRF